MAAITVGRELNGLAVVDVLRVYGVEGAGMAGGAVAPCGKSLARGLVDQPALIIVTREAGIMHLGIDRIDQRRRVAVAIATAGCADLDNGVVIDIERMEGIERRRVAGDAVARAGKRLVGGQADQPTLCIMSCSFGSLLMGSRSTSGGGSL